MKSLKVSLDFIISKNEWNSLINDGFIDMCKTTTIDTVINETIVRCAISLNDYFIQQKLLLAGYKLNGNFISITPSIKPKLPIEKRLLLHPGPNSLCKNTVV